jgi:3-isopropylmalate dehydrogenase
MGLLPSASLGDSGPGLYEPIHGSAPDIAGQGLANPLGTILSAALSKRTPFQPDRVRGANLLIIRELLGGLYFGEPRGFEASGNTAFNTLIYSRHEIERVAKVAFERARDRRKKVASIDKANVLETSRLWRAVVSEVARGYPDVEIEHVYVDTAAMRLATSPTSFDVMLCDNLFGDILSDQAASIAGSLGVLPSATIGGRVDLYEPVHGSAPDIAGQGLANPIGAIASAAMLLRFTAKMEKEAAEIDQAIEDALNAGARTKDIASPGERVLSTREMGQAIEEALHETRDRRHSYHAV